jgi:hypothetical protein
MEQLEGRGCDIPISPDAPSPIQNKPARAKRVFSPNSKKRAADYRKKSRMEKKIIVEELKASGEFTVEMAEVEKEGKRKQAEASQRYLFIWSTTLKYFMPADVDFVEPTINWKQ